MQDGEKLVSVIIPYYNAERYIKDSVESVIFQTYDNVEIICINNNSTDESFEIVDRLITDNPNNIIYNIEEKRKGASIARNTGLKYSKGEYIQFLDADDIIEKDKINKQLEFAISNNADIVVSDRTVMNEGLSVEKNKFIFEGINDNILDTVISQIIITGNPLYKREVVESINGYNEDLESAQDWDFHIRLALSNAKFSYLPGVYFISRDVNNSLSSDWIKVGFQACKVVSSLEKELIKTEHITDKISLKFQSLFYLSAVHASKDKDRKLYISKFEFWCNYSEQSFLSSFKKTVYKLFGINALVWLERIKKNII